MMEGEKILIDRMEYDELVEYRLRLMMIRGILLEPCDYKDSTLDFIRRVAGMRGGEDD